MSLSGINPCSAKASFTAQLTGPEFVNSRIESLCSVLTDR